MSLSRHHGRHVRRAALALGCCALIAPSAGSADKIGDTPADFGKPVTFAPKSGDTPADFPRSPAVTPASGPRAGDTPVDFPGASRAPQFEAPRTIQVVRPERTVVREVNEVLPIVLSGVALLLAMGGVGIALVRTRTARRSLAH
jgi:hypothetical protein